MTRFEKALKAVNDWMESYTDDASQVLSDHGPTIMEALQSSGWRPIATAPKDGSEIMVGSTEGWVMEAYWCEDKGGHWFPPPGFWVDEPTHWRPTLEPPVVGGHGERSNTGGEASRLTD